LARQVPAWRTLELVGACKVTALGSKSYVTRKNAALEQRLDEIAYNLMWDHYFKPIISLKVFSEERFRSAAAKGYSYYRTIEREGITV